MRDTDMVAMEDMVDTEEDMVEDTAEDTVTIITIMGDTTVDTDSIVRATVMEEDMGKRE